MSFAVPLALLGLASVPILVLLDRVRRRPRPLLWPSLLLWRAVAAAAEPRRRTVDPLLLYECGAAALLSLAAAGPGFAHAREARSVVVLIDDGPRTAARRDGTTVGAASRAELARLRASLDPGDVVREFREAGDLRQAAARLPDADLRVVVSDRVGLDSPGLVVVGRAATGTNVGIDAVESGGGRVWFSLACDGPPREVSVRVGGETRRVRTGEGVDAPFAESIEVLDDDNYDGDDRVALRRVDLPVRYDGESRLVRAALFRAGLPAHEAREASLVVATGGGEPVEGTVRGAECVPGAGIFEALVLEDCAWRGVRARPGDGLLMHRGRALAAWLDARTLWLGMPVDAEWDAHGTLAVMLEAAKRARAEAEAGGGSLAGDAIATPPPGFVATAGVDRPWDGRLPEARRRVEGRLPLRALLAGAAVVVLALYARAIVRPA